MSTGLVVGASVVGEADEGNGVGLAEVRGFRVGTVLVGLAEGTSVGLVVGTSVGLVEGTSVGLVLG